MSSPENFDQDHRAPVFATTHWSVVLKAGQDSSEEGKHALETLCQSYWYPLYAFIRRKGHSPHDAQDLTQSFFSYLLEKNLLAKAEPDSGRFRSFLLGTLKNFMANEWRRERAQKRGGGDAILSFDAQTAEERYIAEPADAHNPHTLYEQAWAVAVLDQAIRALEAEYQDPKKRPIFAALQVFLQGERGAETYADVGTHLGMTEGAIKVAVHRLRQRYRELLRASVANTVADPLEIDAELRHLLSVLSG